MNEEIITVNVPMQVGKPLRKGAKLTGLKRKKILEFLAKEWNVSKAALLAGVTRHAIIDLAERDLTFKESMQRIKDYYIDNVESIGLTVATIPSREGFNDRKLMLTSHRDEYKPKPEIQINQQFNFNEGEMDSTLTRILPDNS